MSASAAHSRGIRPQRSPPTSALPKTTRATRFDEPIVEILPTEYRSTDRYGIEPTESENPTIEVVRDFPMSNRNPGGYREPPRETIYRERPIVLDRDYYEDEEDVRIVRPTRRRSTFVPESYSRSTPAVIERPALFRRQSSMRPRGPTQDWNSYYATHSIPHPRDREIVPFRERTASRSRSYGRGLELNPQTDVRGGASAAWRSHDEVVRQRSPIPLRHWSPAPIEYREPEPLAVETSKEATDEVHTIWNTTTKQDSTVHFELEVEHDFGGCIEEFTRLSRLGNFRDADAYFQEIFLDDHLDLPDVALLYADMLLEQGTYNRFYEFVRNNEPAWPKRNRDLYSAKWELTIACADMRARGNLDTAFESINDIMPMIPFKRNSMTSYNDQEKEHWSMTVQIFARVLEIIGYARRHSDLYYDATSSLVFCEWKEVYQSLLKEQRVWDVKDLICASIFAFGVTRTWKNFFDIGFYTPRSFQLLLDDWSILQYDESTYFAMLDIFLAMNDAIASASRISSAASLARDVKATARRCMEHARRFAASIRDNSPGSVKSQAYVRWLLAEEAFAGKFNTPKAQNAATPLSTALSHESFQQYPGMVVTMMTSPHSMYLPIQIENPGWNTSQAKPNEILQLALRTSQELGDTRTQVICLRDLISQSPDPTDLFSALIELQTSGQGDSVGYLETLLCKYLWASNDESYKDLLGDLSQWCGEQDLIGFADPVMQWCLCMIRSALYIRLGQQSLGVLANSEAVSYMNDLPEDMQTQLLQDFDGIGGKDPKHRARVGSPNTPRGFTASHISLGRSNEYHRSQELSSAILARNERVADDVFHPLTRESAIQQEREYQPEQERYEHIIRQHGDFERSRPGPRIPSPSPQRIVIRHRTSSPGYAETIPSRPPSQLPPRRARSNDSVERRSVGVAQPDNQLVRHSGKNVTMESDPEDAKGKEAANSEGSGGVGW